MIAVFGSGISIGAGVPGVYDLTQRILSSSNIWIDQSNFFHWSDKELEHQNILNANRINRSIKIINKTKEITDEFHSLVKLDRSFNYELAYYIISQVYDSTLHELENPLAASFIKWLYEEFDVRTDDDLYQFRHSIRDCLDLIHGVVVDSLSTINTDHQYFGAIKKLHNQYGLTSICTLNHDTLLEDALKLSGISISDGFKELVENISHFDDSWQKDGSALLLFKPHGSVSWRTAIKSEDRTTKQAIIRFDKEDYLTQRNFKKLFDFNKNDRTLLIGTFNKMLDYQMKFHRYIIQAFQENIDSHSRLLVSGYGSGDKGINNIIINWFESNDSNQIQIIHPNPENLKLTARGAFKWIANSNRVHYYPVKFENAKADEIERNWA